MRKLKSEPGKEQAFYTVEEAAAYLRIGPKAIYIAAEKLELPHYKVGKSVTLDHVGLMDWFVQYYVSNLAKLKSNAGKWIA
jgi:excisionase family DNA binding protein